MHEPLTVWVTRTICLLLTPFLSAGFSVQKRERTHAVESDTEAKMLSVDVASADVGQNAD